VASGGDGQLARDREDGLVSSGAHLQRASGEREDDGPTERTDGNGRRPPSTDSRGRRSSPQSGSWATAAEWAVVEVGGSG
jgi:hypothetical protein